MADDLEARVAALETEIAELRKVVMGQKSKTGWKAMVGAFLNDTLYEKAMKYGREYRESMRPKESQKKKRKNK